MQVEIIYGDLTKVFVSNSTCEGCRHTLSKITQDDLLETIIRKSYTVGDSRNVHDKVN